MKNQMEKQKQNLIKTVCLYVLPGSRLSLMAVSRE